MPVYILYKPWRFKMGKYIPTEEQRKAGEYCIKKDIRIFPVCIESGKLWKIGINLGPYKKGEKPNLSPEVYGPGEIQKQMYIASVYYYNKYGPNTNNKRY